MIRMRMESEPAACLWDLQVKKHPQHEDVRLKINTEISSFTPPQFEVMEQTERAQTDAPDTPSLRSPAAEPDVGIM